MSTDLAGQFGLAAASVGALSLLALAARACSGRDPRARERVMTWFVPVLLFVPVVQLVAVRYAPESWRFHLPAPVRRATFDHGGRAVGAPTFGAVGASSAPSATRSEPRSTSGPAVRPSKLNVPLVLLVLYTGGVLVFTLRLARSIAAAASVVRQAVPEEDARVLGIWRRVISEHGWDRRPPQLLVSDRIVTPACGGCLRACVLLPRSIAESADSESLAAAFRHEVEHARRRDPLRLLVEGVLLSLHWFNPAVHAFVRTLRTDRECARDAHAALAGGGPAPYAMALIRFAELARARPAGAPLAALTPFFSERSLQRRLTVMSTLTPSDRPLGSRAACSLAGAMVLALCGTALHAAACAALVTEPPRSIGPASVTSMTDRKIVISAPPGPRQMARVVESLGRDPAKIGTGADTIGRLTEQETVADFRAEGSVDGSSRNIRVDELRTGLPEGSNLSMTIEGEAVEASTLADLVRFTVKNPTIRIKDSSGTDRVVATGAEPASTFTIIASSSAGEATFQILAHKNDRPAPISLVLDAESGRPAGEKEAPAGAVRWQLFPASADKPAARFKMQWIHDDATLKEALKADRGAGGTR